MSQENKSNFAQLKSDRARRLVSGAVQDPRAKTTLWTSGQNISVESRVVACIEKGKEFVVSIRTEQPEKTFLQALASAGIREVFFSMNLATDILFFHAEIRDAAPPLSGAFRVLEPIYMVERRADLRIRIPATESLPVGFDTGGSERLSGSILDLSASGMSLQVSVAASDSMPPGTILKNVSFRFRELEFTTDATVRHVAKVAKDGARVGILFRNLSQRSHDALYRAIVEQSMKYAHR